VAFDDFKFGSVFPTRQGGAVGASEENRMLNKIGGVGGTRTITVTHPDGSTVTCRTRNGFPEFIVTPAKPKDLVTAIRTFVFKVAGAIQGVIANRALSGMAVLKINVPDDRATYMVHPHKTGANASFWRDVVRMTATEVTGDDLFDVLFNTKPSVPRTGVSTVLNLGQSVIPYVAAYQPTSDGDVLRAATYLGWGDSAARKVVSLSPAGTVYSTLDTYAPEAYVRRGSAGLRVKDDGTFMFIGGDVATDTNDVVLYAYYAWGTIKATIGTPWLALTGSGYEESPLMGFLFTSLPAIVSSNFYKDGDASSIAAKYGGTVREWMDSGLAHVGIASDASKKFMFSFFSRSGTTHLSRARTLNQSFTHTANPGSGTSMVATAGAVGGATLNTFSGSSLWQYTGPTGTVSCAPYNGTFESSSSSVITTSKIEAEGLQRVLDLSVKIESTYLKEQATVITGATDLVFDWYPPGTSGYLPGSPEYIAARDAAFAAEPNYRSASGATRTTATVSTPLTYDQTTTFSSKTVDYVFSDQDENIHITLESTLTFVSAYHYVYPATPTTTVTEKHLIVKMVLDIRGSKTEFPIYDGLSIDDLTITSRSIIADWSGVYHEGHYPNMLFAPPFRAQGNCPYIAYTTLAEEAAGSTPQFYLDMKVLPLQYASMPTSTDDLYTGTVKFSPHQFLHVFTKYLQGAALNNSTLWSTLFPTATPIRLQFANGTQGSWASSLGSGFSGDPQMNISRT
jgi:hypothetical protein